MTDGARDEKGRIKPGHRPCGKAKGSKHKTPAEIKEIARQAAPDAIAQLLKLAASARSEAARVMACREILDRALGKATQPIAGEDGGPLNHRFAIEFVDARAELERKLSKLSAPMADAGEIETFGVCATVAQTSEPALPATDATPAVRTDTAAEDGRLPGTDALPEGRSPLATRSSSRGSTVKVTPIEFGRPAIRRL